MSKFLIKSIGNALNATSLVSSQYASKKALSLFATPRKGRYSENQEAIVNSAKFEELQYENLKIATYRWKGTGKTILLAHGWESNASRWNYLLDALKAENYNIITLDAPAHGHSESRQFNAILYSEFINVVAQKFQPEVILGHSVGGMATVFCQYKYKIPSVKKVVLLGSPAHFTGVFARYKSMMGYNRRISNGMEKLVQERYNKPTDYFSAANFTKDFDIDGLIIHDKKDRVIPYEDALLFDKKFKNSELITTEGFGHSLIDASLTPKIVEFING
ncbi:alpha/beta fold hydrolase [Winogradskyella ursingii]|uniref:alpha/beta fold hydrolase n=1 Tax=Winogradskyella ursingii TaxID=2686079 RepID=UPI0015CBE597|nr:alpha/beta hydrolase [Winogradskyella ursingii]